MRLSIFQEVPRYWLVLRPLYATRLLDLIGQIPFFSLLITGQLHGLVVDFLARDASDRLNGCMKLCHVAKVWIEGPVCANCRWVITRSNSTMQEREGELSFTKCYFIIHNMYNEIRYKLK